MSTLPSIPTSTYRIQFHQDFNFQQACGIVPYLHDLGVSHVYASPIFRAAPGSIHGYDICDHNELNPELGSREDFDAFTAELLCHDMRLILDFVPNHMGIAEASNLWWMSVLEDGPSSPFARFFDIDWTPLKMEMANKVLLPILGDQYGRVLERGELTLLFKDGSIFLKYGERLLPTAPRTIIPLLKRVAERLGEEVPAELESILYALEHLPENHETDDQRIKDRMREKEIVRSRLVNLCAESEAVSQEIEKVVADLNASGEGGNYDELDVFISAQSYRLASWQVASEEINYRRFFDVNDLAALRMHLPEVFETTHRLLFELLSTEVVAGIRIDHIDGLCDPREYLNKLQERYAEIHQKPVEKKPLYLLVEKILGHDEALRTDWPVHGTTGYEFGAQAMDILVDANAQPLITRTYQRFSGVTASYAECVYRGKLLVMRTTMPSEVNMLAHMLHHLSQTNRWYRDYTLNALVTALREVIACFPVYRSYITPDGQISHEDNRLILRAVASARRKNPDLERTVFEFLRDVLMPPANNAHPVDEEARLQFVLRFQQCTGPITAKGVEDTAFYVYNRLVSLNEVGGEPGSFGSDVATFHRKNAERFEKHPHCLLASSTHDTKRSEDVRARIAVLSELPQEWGQLLGRWHRANRKFRINVQGSWAPDGNEEYLLYQVLLGSWPLQPMSDEERAEYIGRIQHYMVKALHEAKVNSSWMEPNEEWDVAVKQFVERILTPGSGNKFEESFVPFAERIAELGAVNSLSQTILKLTSPGVPDIYQGQETWDLSLVDPDNRRPVDYVFRKSLMSSLDAAPSELFQQWKDGRIKFLVTHKLLQLRRKHPALFAGGVYEPLVVEGALADHCVAFRRVHEGRALEVLVPRLVSDVGTPPLGDCWQDTHVKLCHVNERLDAFTGNPVVFEGESLPLSQVFKDVPFAVFLGTLQE